MDDKLAKLFNADSIQLLAIELNNARHLINYSDVKCFVKSRRYEIEQRLSHYTENVK